MRYRILNESQKRIRFHIYSGRIDEAQEEILRYAFSAIPGVEKVTVYRATGDCALEYAGCREDIISRLDAFQYQNVEIFSDGPESCINAEEMAKRKAEMIPMKKDNLTGYLKRYSKMVQSASKGAIIE